MEIIKKEKLTTASTLTPRPVMIPARITMQESRQARVAGEAYVRAISKLSINRNRYISVPHDSSSITGLINK
jgi:hypothetical protein